MGTLPKVSIVCSPDRLYRLIIRRVIIDHDSILQAFIALRNIVNRRLQES